MFSTEIPCFPPDPIFFTRPRVFHQTSCFPPDPGFFPHPVFSTRPCVFHSPCFPHPGTPAPRFPPTENFTLLVHIFRRLSDVLFKNLTRKKCVLVSEVTFVKQRMCKIWSTWRWTDFSSLSRLRWSASAGLLLFWAKGHRVSARVGFHGLSFRSRKWC